MFIVIFTLSRLALQNVLYSSASDAMTTWWTGFSDPESGVKRSQIRLSSGGESCTAPNVDNMTILVDFTELSANSSSYEFTHLSLQVYIAFYNRIVLLICWNCGHGSD